MYFLLNGKHQKVDFLPAGKICPTFGPFAVPFQKLKNSFVFSGFTAAPGSVYNSVGYMKDERL